MPRRGGQDINALVAQSSLDPGHAVKGARSGAACHAAPSSRVGSEVPGSSSLGPASGRLSAV